MRGCPQFPQPLLRRLMMENYTNILLVLIRNILYNQGEKHRPFLRCWEAVMDMIKVSANSRTSAVAGAIAGVIREHKHAEVQAIGAGAVNQAIKALVLATGYLRNDGIEIACVPQFLRSSDHTS